MKFRYYTKDYNTGVQLQASNFEMLYPVIYFDLCENKNTTTTDPKQLLFHHNLYKAEFELRQVGNKLVVV